MIVEPARSIEDIMTVVMAVWDSISSDLMSDYEGWEPDQSKDYLIGYIEDKPIGLFVFYRNTDVSLWVHIQVLPEYRKEYAYEFGQKCIDKVRHLAVKLCAQIPVIYPNVIQFAEKSGFEVEGINKVSHLKNGELVDQVYLGMRL